MEINGLLIDQDTNEYVNELIDFLCGEEKECEEKEEEKDGYQVSKID